MVIETENLCKKYGEKTAVKSVSISVKEGEIYGFLGPNGAGKSTFIKMLVGLVFKTSGKGQILGLPLGNVRAREKLGYLPELFRYQEWMTGSELLNFHSGLFGLKADKKRNENVLSRVGLLGQEKYKVGTYSKGMQQRLGLACALLPDPSLLFLDEPTSALDPIGRKEVRDVIVSLKEDGKTVFLNSHLLSEVEAVSDSITIINKGVVVKSGSISQLLTEKTTLTVCAQNISEQTILSLTKHFGSDVSKISQDTISMAVESREHIPKIASFLVGEGALIYELKSQTESLESVFLKAVGNEVTSE